MTVRAGQKVDSTVTATVAPGSIRAQTETATIIVEVNSAERTPTGTVAALVDGVVVGGGELVNGKADVTVGPFTTAGTKTIAMKYYGDALTRGNQASVSLVVTPAPVAERAAATVTTTVSPASVRVVKGRATVSVSVAKATGTPTGAVLALVDGKVVGAAELVLGKADMSLLPFVSVGSKSVEVKSFGDATTKAAASTAVVKVVKANPRLRVKAPSKTSRGAKVRIEVHVSAPGFTPTGKATVKVKGTKVTKTVRNGTVVVKARLWKLGKNKVVVIYRGDDRTEAARKVVRIKVKRR